MNREQVIQEIAAALMDTVYCNIDFFEEYIFCDRGIGQEIYEGYDENDECEMGEEQQQAWPLSIKCKDFHKAWMASKVEFFIYSIFNMHLASVHVVNATKKDLKIEYALTGDDIRQILATVTNSFYQNSNIQNVDMLREHTENRLEEYRQIVEAKDSTNLTTEQEKLIKTFPSSQYVKKLLNLPNVSFDNMLHYAFTAADNIFGHEDLFLKRAVLVNISSITSYGLY